jgi:hypothetical protein
MLPAGLRGQLGAFSSAANAKALQKSQDNKFRPILVGPGGDRTRVRVGLTHARCRGEGTDRLSR